MNTTTDMLALRLQNRLAQAGLDRSDLSLHDYAKIDDETVHLLVAFDSKLGNPSSDSVERFCEARFKGELMPNMATARYHLDQEQKTVSVVASVKQLTRPLADARDPRKLAVIVANTLYMDQQIDANWEVRQNEETGKKYLAQVRKVDLDGLLGSVKNKFATASFDGMQATASIIPEKGDYVRFFAHDGVRTGEVVKTKGQEATINEDDGGTYNANFSEVLEILKKSEKRISREDAELIEQLTPTMGSRELAEELVRTGTFKGKR